MRGQRKTARGDCPYGERRPESQRRLALDGHAVIEGEGSALIAVTTRCRDDSGGCTERSPDRNPAGRHRRWSGRRHEPNGAGARAAIVEVANATGGRADGCASLGIGNRAWEELQRVSKLGFLSEYSTAKDGAKVTCTPSGAATTNRVVRAKGGVMAADRGKHGCGKPETQRRCRRVLVHFFPGADIELNRLVDPKSLVVDG